MHGSHPGRRVPLHARRAPAEAIDDWTGTVEPTVDGGRHVNGGCRSLNAAGTEWSCSIGRAAVDPEIVGPGLLGERSEGPSVG